MAERQWRLGVRGRLVLLATAALALALAAASVLLVVAVRAALVGSLDDAGRQRAADIAALVEAGRLPDPLPVTGSAVVQVIDAQSRVLASSAGGDRLAPLVDEVAVRAVRAGEGVAVDGSRVGSAEHFRVVGMPAGPDDTQTVLVATSSAEVERALSVLRLAMAVGAPVLLLGVGLLTWRVAGSALRPVEELRRGAEQISGARAGSGADQRVLPVPPSRDEVARLAETLNAMLARLDDASDRQRAFLADAAHELRSPLGSLRAQLEVAADRPENQDWPSVAGGALVDVERMTALVTDLLVLARLEGAAPVSRVTLDLGELVRDNASRGSWRVPVEVQGAGALPVLGDGTALRRVVTNLLDNASRHARSRVVVRLSTEGSQAVVDVVDDGPGIAVADRARVFERFTRLDGARARDGGGTGLGLAIARTAVSQHGGSVEALDGDAGSGARLRVRLPLSPPRPDDRR